jgi:hypothetical protein
MRCVGLIDGLLGSGGPGHQYLTIEGVDEALVEVSFMEDLVASSGEARITNVLGPHTS